MSGDSGIFRSGLWEWTEKPVWLKQLEGRGLKGAEALTQMGQEPAEALVHSWGQVLEEQISLGPSKSWAKQYKLPSGIHCMPGSDFLA